MKWELLRVAGELYARMIQLLCLEEVCTLLDAGRDPGCEMDCYEKELCITQAMQGARLPSYTYS